MIRTRLPCLIAFVLLCANALQAAPVRVRYTEGTEHGYLTLRTESGELLGHGDALQIVHGNRVSLQLVLHFKDGSIDDETSTFTQNETFHFVSDHHVQKGPFFAKQLDMLIDNSGKVTLRSTGNDGKEKVETQHIDLPADLSNGMMGVLLNNFSARGPAQTLGMVAPAFGKGRLIKLVITPAGPQKFSEVGLTQTANVFRVHMDLGGLLGAVAPIVGKQPGDVFIWIAQGVAPQPVRLLGPLAEDGPVVSIELSGAAFEPGTKP